MTMKNVPAIADSLLPLGYGCIDKYINMLTPNKLDFFII